MRKATNNLINVGVNEIASSLHRPTNLSFSLLLNFFSEIFKWFTKSINMMLTRRSPLASLTLWILILSVLLSIISADVEARKKKRKGNKKKGGKGKKGGFCAKSKLTLADGTQRKGGSCSATVQGDIPSFQNMVSTIIISPASSANIDSSKPMVISIDTQ